MKDLFDPDKPYFAAWLQVHDIDSEPHQLSALFHFAEFEKPKTATPLYYAALCGLHDLAEQLIIKHPQQVNTTGGYCVSPLGAALSGGHLKIAQLLYERGADVDVRGSSDRTLLYGASWAGHLEIVQWLLSRSANPNVRDKRYGWTPQHLAAAFAHVEVYRLLLQYKADSNAQDHYEQDSFEICVGPRAYQYCPVIARTWRQCKYPGRQQQHSIALRIKGRAPRGRTPTCEAWCEYRCRERRGQDCISGCVGIKTPRYREVSVGPWHQIRQHTVT